MGIVSFLENQNKKALSLLWDKTSILRYHPS